ncbi:MAG: phage tail protein [Acidobacteria bacterium]|nr:phage tail protein [Acidobacteriota bacterium]
MQAGKNQASQKPTAFGSMLQASTYGLVIPEIYGRAQGPLYAIWAANLRQGGSTKKFKQMKKGVTAYCENIDFLCGKNPILSPLQAWSNGTLYPLTFTSWSTTATAGSSGVFTVPDSHFYAIVGVTLTINYDETFNDYGAPGSSHLTGSMELPLWNQLFAGPDPCDSTDPRNFPYRYRWQPDFGATFYIDDLPYGAFPTGTLKVYYAQMTSLTKNQPPISRLLLSFENNLGSGDEYDGFSSQQIIYPMYAGLGSPNIDLGSMGAIPAIKVEHLGKWSVSKDGDCDFVDIIEDVVKNGISQSAMGGVGNWEQVGHGASCFNLPGTIQKKLGASTNPAGVPPMLYDMPNTPGNILVCTAKGQGPLAISSSNGENWTPLFGSSSTFNLWYATAVGGDPNTVSVSGAGQPSEVAIFEIGDFGGVSLSVDSSASFPGSVTGAAAGLITRDCSASIGTPTRVGATWDMPVVQEEMPADAVIQGIYPVMIAAFDVAAGVGTGDANYGTSSGSSGFPLTTSLVEQYGSSLGTSLSRLISAYFNAEIQCSDPRQLDPPWTPVSTLTVQNCAWAIYYTSASSTGPTLPAPMPVPFAPPAGQFVTWAVPTRISPFGQYHHPGGGSIFGGAQGDLTVDGTAFGFNPAPSVTATTPLVTQINVGGFVADFTATGVGKVSLDGSSITQGWPAFLFAAPFYNGDSPANAQVAKYEALTPTNFYGSSLTDFQAHGRIVYNPGTFSFQAPGITSVSIGMIGVRWNDAPRFARPAGGFMHLPSLDNVRAQCRAGGLFGSLAMIAQKSAADWLKDLYEAADAWPVFTGHQLRSIARSEVSAVGNGAIFVAPTASGPVVDLDVDNGDFIAEKGQPAIRVTRKARTDTDTVLQMQHINRGSGYQQVTTAEPDTIGIAKYGVRKKDPESNDAVQDVAIARTILQIRVRRRNYVEQISYGFTVNQRLSWLDSTDLVRITDRSQGIVKVPVRLTSWEENDKLEIACEAEPFAYGIHSPQPLPATVPQPYSGGGTRNQSAGNVNTPVIFEPVSRLYSGTKPQLWIVVSSGSLLYGGCQVYVSTDGGASYNPLGDPIMGSAITGNVIADWPAAADPDTTNDLQVDLTECNGVLDSYAVSDEDNFVYPCYVSGNDEPLIVKMNGVTIAELANTAFAMNGTVIAQAGGFGYELMTYANAQLTATSKYTLKATGAGNKLRRDVFNAPTNTGNGIDHPAGERFALLWPSGTGILKVNMDPIWIGQILKFKILSFNSFGAGAQSLTDSGIVEYQYSPTGVPSTV